MHMYDVVGHPEEGNVLSNKTVRDTNFDDRQAHAYTLPCAHRQERESEYQQPQFIKQHKSGASAGSHAEVRVPSDWDTLRNELKRTKRCLCVLSLLVAILLLTTLAALGLAVYGLLHAPNSASNTLTQLDRKTFMEGNTELVHNFTIFKKQLMLETTHIWENVSYILSYVSSIQTTEDNLIPVRNTVANLQTRVNVSNQELTSLRSVVTILEARLSNIDVQISNLVSLRNIVTMLESHVNATDSELAGLIPLRSSVSNLQNQLNVTTAYVLSLQNNIRSQPSM